MVQKQTISEAGWDDLRFALFLARDGSVRRAARALGVSHSTVLRRIAALEERMGVRLFERKPGGYEATAAGQDVFESAAAVDEIVGALERRVEGRDQRLAGPVRITLPDPLLAPLLPVFAAIGAQHPDIEVTLATGTGYADLAHREADIALRIASDPPPDLVGRRIAQVASGIYGARKYLAKRSTKSLASLDWVRWEAGSSMFYEEWIRAHVPGARTALRASHAWTLIAAVEAGLGVAPLPCATGDAAGLVRVRLLGEPAPPLWILTHRDLRATARVRVLRDLLTEALVAKRALFEGRG
jgi:molybdate transport repressor ModE-like protein